MSVTAPHPLSLQMIANIACAAGIDVGFNAVLATKRWSIVDDTTEVLFLFGDRKELRLGYWGGLKYCLVSSEEATCTREQRRLTFPACELRTPAEIRAKVIEKLLELVP